MFTIHMTTEQGSKKIFHWADLAGSGRNWLVHEDKLVDNVDDGVSPPFYNATLPLNEWVAKAEQGQEWYNETDCYTCIGTFFDVKNLIQ